MASGPRHRPLTFDLPASLPALRAAISKVPCLQTHFAQGEERGFVVTASIRHKAAWYK